MTPNTYCAPFERTRWRGASGQALTVERVEGGLAIGQWDSGDPWCEHVDWLPKLYTPVPFEPEEQATP